MLEYLVTGRAKRELFRLVWGEERVGSVSSLARAAKVNFSAAHRELEAMRAAGLAVSERRGAEVLYLAAPSHPQASLLRQMAVSGPASTRSVADGEQTKRSHAVRGWLRELGAPLEASGETGKAPPLEQVLAGALALAHTDATVARVLPLVLWRQREVLDLDRLIDCAAKLDERQALGYFLELAGSLGKDRRLVDASRRLMDRRRRRPRMFFVGPHGKHALAAARKRSPRAARRWGYLMNTGVDSFRSLFERFSG